MNSKTKAAGIVGALTATVLAAYFYSKTPKGKKQVKEVTKKASVWANAAKRDILKNVKDLEKVNQKTYHSAVDMVLKKYKTVKKIAPKEIGIVSKELKKHWTNAKKEIDKLKGDLLG